MFAVGVGLLVLVALDDPPAVVVVLVVAAAALLALGLFRLTVELVARRSR